MRTGTIGVPSDELARYAAFTASLAGTLAVTPGWTFRFSFSRNIAKNCNHLIRTFEGDMLWFQADDHIWHTEALTQLESHGLDVVVPLMLMRQQPFHPVIYEGEKEDGMHVVLQNPPPNELIEVYAAGSGGMLISRDALEAIGPDPFSFLELRRGTFMGEDLVLCKRLREAGIKIYCDTSVHIGHISTTAVWPTHEEPGGWQVRLDFNSGAAMQ